MRRFVGSLALVAIVGGVVAACSIQVVPVTPSPGASSTSAPLLTIGPPPTAATPVAIDPTLLSVLPKDVGGVPVVESPDAEQDIRDDLTLPTIGSAAVGAVAVDTATSNLVYALVVRLRPDALNESRFGDWRDSYDIGACAGVSQVVGHLQTQIDGRQVYIGTCASGLRTYHVWIPDKALLVSASATGDRTFGAVLMDNLQP